MAFVANLQIGKNGLKGGIIESVKNAFIRHQQVRITVLKAFTREREEVDKAGEKILSALGKKYRMKIIGFTIIISKR